MANRHRTWRVPALALATATLCIAGMLAGTQAAVAQGTPHECSGGTWANPTMLDSGSYDGLTVSGLCMVVPGSTVTINGPVIVDIGAILFAISPQTMTITGNVSVADNAILALGCSAAIGCDGTDNNPPSRDTVNGDITATNALAMYLNGDTVNGDTTFSGGGWGRDCTDPNADDPSDPLGHDLVVKDNTFNGSVTLDGWAGCWMGFIRNRVTGSVTISDNYANPANIINPGTPHEEKQGLDSTEIISNLISGDLTCQNNTPAAQVGDSQGSVNMVHGTVTGECVPISVPTATPCTSAPFKDVPTAAHFCGDIAWLDEQNIAGGYTDGTFRPAAPVSRQAMAAFLYRMQNAGGTAPACTTAPFNDVPITNQFCGAIAWLATQKITGGYGDGGFHPSAPVSRQAMAAFLYRMLHPGGTAPACSTNPFPDVPAANEFCGAIAWLVSQRVTGGYLDGGFHPTAAVSRQAMAAFLYRITAAGG